MPVKDVRGPFRRAPLASISIIPFMYVKSSCWSQRRLHYTKGMAVDIDMFFDHCCPPPGAFQSVPKDHSSQVERKLRPARNDAFVSVCHTSKAPKTLGTSIWLHSYLAQATVHSVSFNRGPKPSPLQDQLRGFACSCGTARRLCYGYTGGVIDRLARRRPTIIQLTPRPQGSRLLSDSHASLLQPSLSARVRASTRLWGQEARTPSFFDSTHSLQEIVPVTNAHVAARKGQRNDNPLPSAPSDPALSTPLDFIHSGPYHSHLESYNLLYMRVRAAALWGYVPTCSVRVPTRELPMPFGKGAGIISPWLVPRRWQQKYAGRPLYFSGGESATLVWNANVSSVRSRVLASIKNADSYSPLRLGKTHSKHIAIIITKFI
ncbi:hypothetical protein V8E53_005466 [Lactarius tabidus]